MQHSVSKKPDKMCNLHKAFARPLLKSGLETAGVIVLEDESVYLERDGKTIVLLGLEDPNAAIKGDLFGEVPAMIDTKLSRLVSEETGYMVLLFHRPNQEPVRRGTVAIISQTVYNINIETEVRCMTERMTWKEI